MKKVLMTFAFSACIMVAAVNAQSYKKSEFGIKAIIKSVEVDIQFYNSSTVRVLKSPEGKTFTKKSLSVIEAPQKTALNIKQSGNELFLKSTKVQVELNLNDGTISFSTAAGDPMLREKQTSAEFTNFNDAGVKTYSVSQSIILDKDEAIYGLGQQQQGKMNQRGDTLHMIEGNTDDYIPYFLSVKGYGLFWDNYSPTLFVDNPDSTTFKSDVGNCIDYYFMYGGNAHGVIARMRELTGQVPMEPLWTYGYWQSRERYKSQNEIVGVVKKYRELGVPLDGIIQDWQYWGDNYHWNAMQFLNPEFPHPQKMIDEIHDMHAHIIISVWASFGPKTKQYEVLNKKGMLLDFKTWPLSAKDVWPPDMRYPSGVRVYDAYNPEARKIFWNFLNKDLFSLGIDGWWLDSSEPDHLNVKPSDFDDHTYLGSFRKVRNAFPLMHVGGVFKGQRAVSSKKRVFILTRSMFAGQQRYGADTWSGDVVASWNALRDQISAGLNFSLCGLPYWNSDIGGFFLWNFPQKLKDANYRELYARWIQFGAFCPMMRSHGTDAPREIYQFGKKGDEIYDAIDKYINLRYRLLPYIYSTSWEVTSDQATMMRALVMDFPEDRQVLNINNEYMFGKTFLVCPVTKPMYSRIVVNGSDTTKVGDFNKVKSDEVYLPKGTDWIDFWTGDKLSGGQSVNKETPIDIMPLYVRAGSILPVGPKVQYAAQKKWDDLEIRVYPGADGKFTLYEDENDNYDYQKGIYSTITFTWNNAKKVLTIGKRMGSFPGMLKERKFRIVVVTPKEGIGMVPVNNYNKVINYDGKDVSVKL